MNRLKTAPGRSDGIIKLFENDQSTAEIAEVVEILGLRQEARDEARLQWVL